MKTSISKIAVSALAVGIIALQAACTAESTRIENNSRSVSSDTDSSVSDETPPTATAVSVTSATESAAVTTVAESTAEQTTAAAETTPAATAEPTWKETKKSAEMYLNTSVYSRTKAYIGAPTADLYQINDKVKIIAITDTNYYKLENGCFIHSDYLSSQKTVFQTTAPVTEAVQTTASAKQTVKQDKPKPTASGKYISSGYSPLDSKIEPILNSIITKNMNDRQKLKAVYDYLMQFDYFERTLLIPNDKKQYSEQLYTCFILDNRYGVCYDFTSAFKYMTAALGYKTRMIYGYHTNPAGGAGEHSWAELDINGTTYIFDPAIEKILISEGYGGSSRFMRTYDEIGKYYIFN